MKLNIGINDGSRSKVSTILNTLLADEVTLYVKTRNFHWNVTGPQFNDLHKFFEAQYEELDEIMDEVAERARSLGAHAAGTLSEYVKTTRLKERPGAHLKARDMINALLNDHEMIIRELRRDLDTAQRLGDMGTSDFLTGLMEQHEKMSWMLRSFLE